jgi:TrmH family RNA methyltransferase
MRLDDVRFVLVRPGSGGNIGAVARAMKNMGWRTLDLVDPRPFDAGEARRLAHNATDVLRTARRPATLATAVADCRWVVGTTRRQGRRRRATLTPREFARLAFDAQAERRPLALVFGPEEDGLGSAELALCHDVVRIPADAAQPSLNLAQALLLLAYELRLARPGTGACAPVHAPHAEASAAELEQFYAHLEAALLSIRFVRADTAPHRILLLRRLLGRARLQPAEVRLLRGICRQILWAAGRMPDASTAPPAPAPSPRRRRAPATPRTRRAV